MFQEFTLSGELYWKGIVIPTEELTDQISHYSGILSKYGDGDTPVALRLSKKPGAVICMLVMLEQGIPFLNIDKAIPVQRVQYMLETVHAKVMISDEDYHIDGVEIIRLSDLKSAESKLATKNTSEIAYYLFTSGTTGRPKAVPIRRSSLANFIQGMDDILRLEKGTKILNLTSYSFDIVFLELFYSLYKGMQVVLCGEEETNNMNELITLIKESKVEVIQMTPSRLKMFRYLRPKLDCFSGVKYLLIGGEAFPFELLKDLQDLTKARIFNMYGPTETTIWSSVAELTNANEIHIGSPILNTEIYILSEDDEILEPGKEGEIAIAGAGLSPGYWGNEEATRKAFVQIMVSGRTIRVYKTGDVGKYSEEGILYCYGRIDNQIKLNGHRIETEDIDSNLTERNDVIDAVTCLNAATNTLVTFYKAENDIAPGDLNAYLSERLPDYMLPITYIQVSEFDYTISGKTDCKKMLEHYVPDRIERENNRNLTSTEQRVSDIFRKHMIEEVTKDSVIKEIVPDSVIYVQILVALEEEFDFEFDTDALEMSYFQTIHDLIDCIKSNS